MTGRLIAVVGPSGVGKDSVMAGIADACPAIRAVRRVITRAPGLGGEDYEPVTEAIFMERREQGAFCLHWGAHGLYYGIPKEALESVLAGEIRMANLSRGALSEAQRVFPTLIVLHLTARPETLAARLAGRGREDARTIRDRLARADHALPDGITAHDIANDGALEETVARALTVLQPESA